MDSFDDLLPSQSALEDNPFATHFGGDRSSSPDPWASQFFRTQHDDVYSSLPAVDAYTPSFESPQERLSLESGDKRPSVPASPKLEKVAEPVLNDPLELAAHANDDDHEPRSDTQLSGFRQSRDSPPSSFNEIATIRPTGPEPFAATTIESTTEPLSASDYDHDHDHERNEQNAKSPEGQDDDDSDDDKPISQTLSKIQSEDLGRAKMSSMQMSGRNDIPPVFSISVDDPQKVGDPIRSFTMYTVHTRTTSPLYQKSSFSVLRRYSDFLWLYETLQFNNPGVVVPPVPEKNILGRFDDTFVRQRRLGLEKCIHKIASHPVLSKDEDLKFFLESDTFALDMKHRKTDSAHDRGGLIASIGQSLTGPRFHETDEWFDRQKGYLDSLESQLKSLVKAIEMVAKQRQELALVNGEFAQTISDLASSDVGAQLSQSLSGLADVERKAQELQMTQSDQDMVTILATSDEYSRLINSVRLAFSSRIRTYHQWKHSESELLRLKKSHEKNKAQGQNQGDRMSYSLQQIAEAERRASECKLEFEQVSKLVKQEMARFERERIGDFKDSLHAFLEGMIARQKELISTWENYQQTLLRRTEKAPGQTPVLSS